MNNLFDSSRQAGAALITSLIFLTVLTILGMSTLGTALLESRMAGNARDRSIAFQAAEMGLRDAELYISNSGRIVGLNEKDYDIDTACLLATEKCDAQLCRYGLCYNGGTMNEDNTDWAGHEIWAMSSTFWANAIQYQHDDATGSNKAIGRDAHEVLEVPGTGTVSYTTPANAIPLVRRQPEYLIEAFQKSAAGVNRVYYRITVNGYGVKIGTLARLQEVYSPN